MVMPNFTKQQKDMLVSHARDMLGFYFDNVNERTKQLPPDNIQLSPVSDTALRTSPTNIGFYLVSMLAALDLGMISVDGLCERLEATLDSVECLKKYKGNLYNWYSLTDLSVIGDGYISSVDSGNFTVAKFSTHLGIDQCLQICAATGDQYCDPLHSRITFSSFSMIEPMT